MSLRLLPSRCAQVAIDHALSQQVDPAASSPPSTPPQPQLVSVSRVLIRRILRALRYVAPHDVLLWTRRLGLGQRRVKPRARRTRRRGGARGRHACGTSRRHRPPAPARAHQACGFAYREYHLAVGVCTVWRIVRELMVDQELVAELRRQLVLLVLDAPADARK